MKARSYGLWLSAFLALAPALASDPMAPDAGNPARPDTQGKILEMLRSLSGINEVYGACESVQAPEVVSDLCATLDQADLILKRRIILCLGSTGESGGPAVPVLIRSLEDLDTEVQNYAFLSLGQLGPVARDAVPALTKLLHRRNYRIVNGAIHALGGIGRGVPTARQSLIHVLSHGEAKQRYRAAETLGFCRSHTSDVVIALTEALSDNDKRVRDAAARSLGELGSEAADAVPELLSLFRNGDEWEKGTASSTLAAITNLRDLGSTAILEGLQSRRQETRVLSALGTSFGLKRGDPQVENLEPEEIEWDAATVVPGLIETLGDSDTEVVAAAAWALRGVGPRAESAVPALRVKTRDKNPNVRRSALYALERIDEGARASTAERIEATLDKDDLVRAAAVGALGDVDPAIAVDVLSVALTDPVSKVRLEAAISLGEIGVSAKLAVPFLVSTLKDSDPHIVWVAIGDLERMGPAAAQAIPDFVELVLNPGIEASIRSDAIRALVKIDPAGLLATSPICDVLAEPPSESDEDPEEDSVRLAAVQALCDLEASGDAAVAALTDALGDRDHNVVNMAAYALGRLGSKARRAVPALKDLLHSQSEWIYVRQR